MLIIPPIFCYLNICGLVNGTDCFNIATNLYCGIVVGLITSICQLAAGGILFTVKIIAKAVSKNGKVSVTDKNKVK